MKNNFLITVFVISILFLSNFAICWGSWEEVVSFSGSGDEFYNTGFISINYDEWKILWEYLPDADTPELAAFFVDVYTENEDGPFYSVYKLGKEQTFGVEYVENLTGKFFMYVDVANVSSYSIVVEQNLDSIPEFMGFGVFFSLLLLIFPLVYFKGRILLRLHKHNKY